MKKIIITLLPFLLFIPFITKAETVDYDIKHYYINADIKENGDTEVSELLVIKGSFNGYVRDIVYKNSNLKTDGYSNNKIYNATGIEIKSVAAKKVNTVSFATLKDTDFKELTKNQASNYGYIESTITNGKSYKMYFKSYNDTVAFKITYTIKDVVVLHKDVAELYWTFIGSDYEDNIRDLQIRVNLPKKDTSSNFRVWAHGDMAGEINKYDESYLLATISKLDAHSPVDIRTTFDTSLIDKNEVTKQTKEMALNGIIEVETARAEEQNALRKKAKTLYYGFLSVSILYLVSLITAWIYVYFKFDKEYKSTFYNEYNRDFIDDYNVEVVDYLMNKKITPNAMSASIMNLIYKKVISVEEIPTEKKKKEYKFILTENLDHLNETEKYLTRFLFETVGSDNTFTTKELKSYASGTKTCEKFLASYNTWKKEVTKDANNQNFFEKTGTSQGIGILFLIISILLCVFTNVLEVVLVLPFLNTIVAVIFFIYTLLFFKRTQRGNEHYARWSAFKKFLNDFGTFDTKELPEIALWERYMVYATVFGLAEKVSKVMNVKIKELETNGVYVGGYYPTFTDWYVFNSIHNTITNSIQANTTAITRERANSARSSGSGFGGGFSSGGGFGGGGGGGHGF